MTERVNIRRLQVPRETDEVLKFDAKKELTQGDRHQLWAVLREYKRDDKWEAFAIARGHMHFLGMTRPPLEEDEREKILGAIDSCKNHGEIGLVFMCAVAMRMLQPNKSILLSETDWENAKGLFRARWDRQFPDVMLALSLASDMYAMDPSRSPLTLEDASKWETLLQRNILDPLLPQGFATVAASARVLGLPMNLKPEDWAILHQHLADLKASDSIDTWDKVPELAAHMQILAAESVVVTDKGLVVSMKKKKSEHTEASVPATLDLQK